MPAGLQRRHLSRAELQDYLQHHAGSPHSNAQSGLLGMLVFATAAVDLPADIPVQHIHMQVLHDDAAAAADACGEAWYSAAGPMQSGTHSLPGGGQLHFRHDADYVFGVITLPETQAAADSSTGPLQHSTDTAYRHLFALLDQLGFQQVYRLWNYMAHINDDSHGQERYRQFNIGRQDAFLACQRSLSGSLPAACALGTATGPLTIAFLAGHAPAQAVENPRQVSAYQYPDIYGPRSPSFARATLLPADRDKPQQVLFISGTASIVGHHTLHAGDVVAQTRETLANLQALVEQSQLDVGPPQHRSQPLAHAPASFSLQRASYRVYVRHADDMPRVKLVMLDVLGAGMQAVYLQADVCRSDLLVEIEATLFASGDGAAQA